MTFPKNTTPKRAAVYLRVSTDGQTTDNQLLELKKAAEHAGWEIVDVYEDKGISGAKGREKRPGFDRLCKDATRRKFDVVMSWSVDRLGRSLQDLVGFLSELHSVGVDLFLFQQGLDTTTPAGKAMFQMMGVFAEFERAMISERVKAGLNRAKADGKTLGRRPTSQAKVKKIMDAKAEGLSIRKIAAEVGVSRSVVHSILQNAA